MADEVVQQVKQWGAERVVLLPLYPQFSTTTTSSFVTVWEDAAKKHNLTASTHTVCCFPFAGGYVTAMAENIKPVLAEAKKYGTPRVLFSAHGLPQSIVSKRGDPYPIHVQRSAAEIAAALGETNLDWLVSFQSRVGPLAWVKPYTIDEIHRAARESVPLVVVPLAFVSEHLETLVELDIEYRHVADEEKIPFYGRVPTVSTHPLFMAELRDLVLQAAEAGTKYVPPGGRRICPAHCHACPCGVKR
jgi:ferrochelatase